MADQKKKTEMQQKVGDYFNNQDDSYEHNQKVKQ